MKTKNSKFIEILFTEMCKLAPSLAGRGSWLQAQSASASCFISGLANQWQTSPQRSRSVAPTVWAYSLMIQILSWEPRETALISFRPKRSYISKLLVVDTELQGYSRTIWAGRGLGRSSRSSPCWKQAQHWIQPQVLRVHPVSFWKPLRYVIQQETHPSCVCWLIHRSSP